jgi:nucleolar complex protein 2
MKSYLGNSIHLLSSMTQPAMTAFTLRRLRASAPFLGPFNHLAKKLMRLGLKLYGSEEPGPRLQVGSRNRFVRALSQVSGGGGGL